MESSDKKSSILGYLEELFGMFQLICTELETPPPSGCAHGKDNLAKWLTFTCRPKISGRFKLALKRWKAAPWDTMAAWEPVAADRFPAQHIVISGSVIPTIQPLPGAVSLELAQMEFDKRTTMLVRSESTPKLA